MCCRYVVDDDGTIIAFVYGVPRSRMPGITRSYNAAPTQQLPIVREDQEGRRVDLARWGLIPFWAKNQKIGYSLINARAEELDTKPAFREAFSRRRCLIPASGFFD